MNVWNASLTRQLPRGGVVMSFVETKDGTEIY